MRGVLIRIDSVDSVGTAAPVFLASMDDPRLCHLDGENWIAAISRLPSLRYDFFGGAFNGQISAPISEFAASIAPIDDFGDLVFASARVRVWEGAVGDAWGSFTLRYDGLIDAEPTVERGIASFGMRPDDSGLDEPLLATYAGTGGIEGPDDLEGTEKPLALGNTRFADGRLLDATNLVYQVNDGAVEGVNAVYDRAAALGASTGDYADLAALIAASVPAGGWATCIDLGLVRLGAPPDGRVAFDVSGDNGGGYVRKPGAIIGRLASIAGITTDATNLSDLDTSRPYNLQIDLLQQTTARQVIQSVADSVCAVAGISWTGTLFVQPLAIDASPSVTFDSDGTSEYAVGEVSALTIAPPYWRLATQAERTWVVYGFSEVATGYNIRGEYSAAREYRLDDLVYLSDGSAWVYDNATPSSGNTPSDGSSYWTRVTSPTGGAGQKVQFVFQAAASAPSTPTGDGIPTGWSASPPVSSDPIWVSSALQELDGTLVSGEVWSTPIRFDGEAGADGAPGADGADGADGAPAVSGYLTNEHFTVPAYADGVVDSYSGATGDFKVFSGGTDVSSNFALSTLANPQSLTIGYVDQTFTVTAGFDAGENTASVTIRATGSGAYAGVTIDKTFTLGKTFFGYQIVASLPATNLFQGRMVFLTTDDKLYRYDGSAWTTDIAASDITGQVASTQLAVGVGGNMLVGAVPSADPNDFLYLGWNPDSVPLQTNGTAGEYILSPIFGSNYPTSAAWTLPDNSTFCIQQTDGTVGTEGYADFYFQYPTDVDGTKHFRFPVEEGKTYELSVYIQCHRCDFGVLIGWRDSSGAGLGATLSTVYSANTASPADRLEQYQRTVARGVAPAGATQAILVVRKYNTYSGQANSYLFGCRPMFGETGANATDPLPWSVPAVGLVNAQNILSDTIETRHLQADSIVASKIAAGAVTAAKISVTQLSSITATIGTLQSAASGARTVVQTDKIQVYDSSGVERVRIGNLA